MWNPTVALGTVTHEYIGYLLPMGPFFGAASLLHVPTWVAQRLWLGAILFAAGAGILYLCRVLTLRGPGRVVAALAFMLSPYFLQYAGRISVILLPWAGLPWMVALAALALRRGGWRYPALFALVVATVSGINASSIIYVGRGARSCGSLYAVAVEHEATWRRAGAGRPADGRPDRAGAACGGSPGCRSRRPTASTCSSTPRPSRPPAPPRAPPRSSGAWATGTSTAATGWGRGPSRPSSTPSGSGCSPSPTPSPSWPSARPCWCGGATAPTSCPWWWSGWCSRSGPTPTHTPRRSAGCSSAS